MVFTVAQVTSAFLVLWCDCCASDKRVLVFMFDCGATDKRVRGLIV